MNDLFQYYIVDKKHIDRRIEAKEIAEEYKSLNLSEKERMTRRFEYLMSLEQPFILENENIPFCRYVKNTPEIYTQDEWDNLKSKYYIHESGYKSNLCPSYSKVLNKGLLALNNDDEYFTRVCKAIFDLTNKYKQEAQKQNRTDLVEILSRVPAYPARSFHEALVSLRIINFSIWVEGEYQISLGRIDQYLYPYLKHDLDNNIITLEKAYDLLYEFFLSLNKDNDIYPGVQPGDNGQSLMIGGLTQDGTYLFNEISRMVLKASEELKLIDPKINIRVDSKTPEDVYTLCTRLTKVGLGFPQYSNDDVVIKGLCNLGYEYKDAVEYCVAACWEFIIPEIAEDVVNINALSFPKVIDECLHNDLLKCNTYDDFLNCIKTQIEKDVDINCNNVNNLHFVCAPLLDGLMNYKDNKPKYINYGMHGVGISTGVDSLTVIQKHIYEDKDITKQKLINAVDNNFIDTPELLHLLRYETEKLGSNENTSNNNLVFLLNCFSDYLNNKPNDKGGIWRAGTGTAMYYLWSADEIGASPDGRRDKEPLATNYSVSLFADINPFSLLNAMTTPDLTKIINGGPLTLEFHSSVFNSEEAIRTVGLFVREFILKGGHQLQLNAVNAGTLKDAQNHPEKYPLLIVRVWGWSAYFVDLNKPFQDQVISRQEYVI